MKTVTAAEEWKWFWTGLPKYKDGKIINWSVTEDSIPNYERTVSGYNVTNTYNPGKRTLTVEKVWTDSNDQDGKRPDYAQAVLVKDGTETDQTCIMIAANSWTCRFEGLDRIDPSDGHLIQYTVKESPVPAGYKETITGDMDSIYKITNLYSPETVKIVVTKTWDDAGNESNRPGTINLYLQADGAQIRHEQFPSAETAAAGWKWVICRSTKTAVPRSFIPSLKPLTRTTLAVFQGRSHRRQILKKNC